MCPEVLVNNNPGGAKGLLDSINWETVVHGVVIVLVALIAYHLLFHTV